MLVIMASVFVGGALGFGAYFALKKFYPLYESAVLFEVQPEILEAGDINATQKLKEEDIDRIGNTELMLVISRGVLRSAVESKDVRQSNWFKQNYTEGGGGDNVGDAVDELEEDLRTGVLRGTNLFEVRWATHNRYDVTTVLGALADSYLEARKRIDEAGYQDNLQNLEDEADKTKTAIRNKKDAIKQHIRNRGIVSLQDARYSQAAQALEQLTKQMTDAAASLEQSKTAVEQDRMKLDGMLDPSEDDIREAELDYSVAQSIRTTEALKIELLTLREQYPSDHSQVRAAESRLRASESVKDEKLDEVIRRNIASRVKSLDNLIQQYDSTIDGIDKEMETKTAELEELAESQAELAIMQSELEQLERSRDDDEQLIKELNIMRLRDDARVARLWQLPEEPRELYFPKAVVIVPLFVLLTVGLTVGAVFLRELTDSRVKTASDVAVIPGGSVLGVVPDVAEDPTRCQSADLVVAKAPDSVMAESYRQSATVLLKSMDMPGHQTLLFTGGLPGSGATTAAVNLATSIAASGRRVVIVDTNFRRPRLAELFGLEAGGDGIGDVLAGTSELADAISSVEEMGLDVITAGTPASRVVERLTSERVGSVIAELRGRYDIVIFDAPPSVVAGDAMALASRMDAVALVVQANRDERGLVARQVAQLGRTGADLLGIVLNRARITAGGYFKKNFKAMAAYATQD